MLVISCCAPLADRKIVFELIRPCTAVQGFALLFGVFPAYGGENGILFT